MTLMIKLGRYVRSIMCPQKIDYKQLLDEVFVMSGIIKVVVSVTDQPSRRPRLITLTKTLIIRDLTKTESNNCLLYIVLKK